MAVWALNVKMTDPLVVTAGSALQKSPHGTSRELQRTSGTHFLSFLPATFLAGAPRRPARAPGPRPSAGAPGAGLEAQKGCPFFFSEGPNFEVCKVASSTHLRITDGVGPAGARGGGGKRSRKEVARTGRDFFPAEWGWGLYQYHTVTDNDKVPTGSLIAR